MPEKSVREMSDLERKHYSLEARVFHASLLSCILLGLVALLIGLGLYAYALRGQYITEAFQLSRNSASALVNVTDVAPMSERTMELYHSMTDAERAGAFTEEYRSRYAEISAMPEYELTLGVLNFFREDSDVSDLYIAMYDEETTALVYIADPDEDPDYICKPGDWETVKTREVQTFLTWNGEGMLYDVGLDSKYGWICTAGVPIRDDAGKIVAFVLSDITLEEVAQGMKNFFLQYFIATTIVTAFITWFTTRRMKKMLVKPINEIAEAAQAYVDDKRNGERTGEHFASLNIRTGDEVENLSLIMADMEEELGDYVTNLTRVTAEKERVSTELNMATQIQESMLPTIFPAFPDRPEFDIYAKMDPAREVGGDFYDFFLIDDDHLCMVMADVSGKGVPAALFMMASKILINNLAMVGKSPAEILMAANNAICSNNRLEMFVTVWLGILEISTGKVTASNAGHEYPALKHRNGKYELVRDKHGLVIGGMPGVRYKEYELDLEPGSTLFLYTDGVPEATDAENNFFGTERMLDALNVEPDGQPEKVLSNVRAAVDDFVKDAEQFDDLTMLCMEYKGGSYGTHG